MISDSKGVIRTWPVDELYECMNAPGRQQLEADVEQILQIVNGTLPDRSSICREYDLTRVETAY